MPINRVHFTDGDQSGWAIDEDLRLLRSSIRSFCKESSLARSEVVHAVWWQRLLRFTPRDFLGKHLLCYADNAPFFYASEPEFLRARQLVSLWIARSREAINQFASLGIQSKFAPYTFDPNIFHPLPQDNPETNALIEKWSIPRDRYLIANFHRDTEGGKLQRPKLQKGPDAFLEIVTVLHQEGRKIHVLLAGPRRFYLRTQLAQRGVPFSFIGTETNGRDDVAVNILSRSTLNLLYNIANLHLISSRWEGGPHSVLESAGAKCRVISTPVGIAPDVLEPECLYSGILEACEIIRRDLDENFLENATHQQFDRAIQNHTEPALQRHLLEIYRPLEKFPSANDQWFPIFTESVRHLADRIRSCFPPPAKQFSIALLDQNEAYPAFAHIGKNLEKSGATISYFQILPSTNCVLLGQLPPDDPILATLRARPDIIVVGFLDSSARENAIQVDRPLDRCTIIPSLDVLDAFQKHHRLPKRAVVFPLDTLPKTPVHSAISHPLIIPVDNPWAADQIFFALAEGRPVLYPADSHYGWLVWFGGLPYSSPSELNQHLSNFPSHAPIFARMLPEIPSTPVADFLLRLFQICRDLPLSESPA